MPREGQSGYIPVFENFRINVASGTSAEEYVTDITSGYKRILKACRIVASGDGAGAGGSRTFRVIKGASTVAASTTLALASTTTKGTVVTMTNATNKDDRTFYDADLITIDVASGGTQYTTLTFNIELEWLIRAQQVNP